MRKFQALSLSAALLASLLLGGCANNAASSDPVINPVKILCLR